MKWSNPIRAAALRQSPRRGRLRRTEPSCAGFSRRSPARTGLQLLARGGHDLSAVLCSPPLEHLCADAAADLPAERHESSVCGDRHLPPRGGDQGADLAHQDRHVGLDVDARDAGSRHRRGVRQLSQRCCDFLRAARRGFLTRALRHDRVPGAAGGAASAHLTLSPAYYAANGSANSLKMTFSIGVSSRPRNLGPRLASVSPATS